MLYEVITDWFPHGKVVPPLGKTFSWGLFSALFNGDKKTFYWSDRMAHINPSPEQENQALVEAMAFLTAKVDAWTLAHPREFTTAYPALSIYRHESYNFV